VLWLCHCVIYIYILLCISEDFRIFCGDLGNEVTEEILARAFSKYPSFQKAKVVRDKRTNKTRGYGFIALSDPSDFVRAMREMNGKS
jgi:RNA recognition motif-containing protein